MEVSKTASCYILFYNFKFTAFFNTGSKILNTVKKLQLVQIKFYKVKEEKTRKFLIVQIHALHLS